MKVEQEQLQEREKLNSLRKFNFWRIFKLTVFTIFLSVVIFSYTRIVSYYLSLRSLSVNFIIKLLVYKIE